VPYAIERYSKESKRLLGVLEQHLQSTGGPFIMGQDYTIAGKVLSSPMQVPVTALGNAV